MGKPRPIIVVDGRYGLRAPRRGIGEYVYRLLVEMAFIPRPYDLHVFGDPAADPEVVRRIGLLHSVDLLMSPTFFTWEQIAWPQVLRNAALVHGTANIGPVATLKPLVLTVHDVIEWHRGQDVPGHIRWRHRMSRTYRMTALRALVRRAQAIFTVSRHASEDIQKVLEVSPEKIVVTPLAPKYSPVDTPVFPKKPYILVLGALDPRKNLRGALKAFKQARLSQISLKVVGLEPETVPLVEQWIHEEQLDGRVTVQAMVTDEELQDLYRHATAFFYPSYYEGFGLPVLEAMGQGCPVIVSNRTSLPEVAGSAALYVDPYNTQAMATSLAELIRNAGWQRELADSGIRHAQSFHWRNTALLTHETYLQVLSRLGQID